MIKITDHRSYRSHIVQIEGIQYIFPFRKRAYSHRFRSQITKAHSSLTTLHMHSSLMGTQPWTKCVCPVSYPPNQKKLQASTISFTSSSKFLVLPFWLSSVPSPFYILWQAPFQVRPASSVMLPDHCAAPRRSSY